MLREDAGPFRFAGDHRGVLLLHGFTGTPFEVRHLGRRLADRGFTVSGPTLVGHGGAPEELDRTCFGDWLAGVDRELEALRTRCSKVAIVGQSLGGLLALEVARARGAELGAVGSLGAPLWLPAYARGVIPLWRLASRWVSGLTMVPKFGGVSDVRDPEMKRENPSMKVFPVNALASLLDFTRVVRGGIGEVTVPTFVAHGREDHTAPPACAEELVRRVGARDVRYLVLERSYHMVTIDVERDLLAEELAKFLAERL